MGLPNRAAGGGGHNGMGNLAMNSAASTFAAGLSASCHDRVDEEEKKGPMNLPAQEESKAAAMEARIAELER